ncbi:MAG: substrate-binding domain-containing protein, partial [Bacteroidales bacterium]|nr:substrate-binding domain-containing protein [Bacteroidales bacterium]
TPGLHKEILKRNIPFVMFDRVFRSLEVNKVLNDNLQGAYAVIQHMIEQGYSEILHLTGPLTINIYKERTDGFKEALRNHGLPVQPEYIIEKVITKEQGYEEIRKRLKSGFPFDAIFSAGDFSAQGALLCLRDMEIKVPDQVGLAGFANEPFTAFLAPSLTTVDQRGTEMGGMVADMFLNCEEKKSLSRECEKMVLKPELIIRNSSLLNR